MPRGGAAVELPVHGVAAVRFQPLAAATAGEWTRLLKMKTSGDLLVVAREGIVDYHQGTVRDVTDKTVEFDLDGEVVPVPRTKVFGLIYHAADQERAEPLCWITDAGGSRWAAQSLSLAGNLQWTTVAGASASCPLDQVVQIDLSRGKIVYLERLEAGIGRLYAVLSLGQGAAGRAEVLPPPRGPEPGIEAAAVGRKAVQQGAGPAQPHRGGLLSARPIPPLRGRGGHRRRRAAPRQRPPDRSRRRQTPLGGDAHRRRQGPLSSRSTST